jgi:hypothetical protein
MEHTIREFDVCRWPPPLWLIEEAKEHLSEKKNYKLEEYVRLAEYSIKLFNTVYEALAVIEEAEKSMTSESYMRLVDSMHSLALVGERKSDLYIEMFHLAQRAANRICNKHKS